MKKNWKQTLALLTLSVSLLIPTAPFRVIAQEAPSVSATRVSYHLTNSIRAVVKSILNEQSSDKTRIGAVVRLYNEGTRVTRIPDYEVRINTKEGIEYILRPSTENAKAIQPRETVELSYMIVVDRDDAISLSVLTWVDVDEYVYPKRENTIISIPISSLEWKGANTVLSDPAVIIKWGETFTIPVLSTSLEYKPVSLIEQNTPHGPMTILNLLVINKSSMKKSIPDFLIDGKSDKKAYNGNRLEQGTLALEPGEQRYIHYAIPARNRRELKSLTVLTSENFAAGDQTRINYSVGQLKINLPDDSNLLRFMDQLESYEWNKPIQFDPLNELIQPEVDISMVALHMHESEGGGFKAAVAKFILLNRSDHSMPVPNFQAELMNITGDKYMGTRQTAVVGTLIPNISYVIYYSFILPNTEKGEHLVMEIMDGETVAPYNIPIAMFRTQAQLETADTALTFYPFNAILNHWTVEMNSGSAQGDLPFTYKLKLDLDINRQQEAVVDQSFPKMKVELVDVQGKIVGSKTLSFTGENRLTSGMLTITINSARFENSLSLRIYETIDTPFGEAERLMRTVQPY